MAREKYSAKKIIEALQKTKGMIYLAAQDIGCSPNTIYNYAKRYPTVQQAIDTERGKFLDVAELALFRAVEAGEAWAVAFALKTIGKRRGYTERTELQHDWRNELPEGWRADEVQKQFTALMVEARRRVEHGDND